MTVTKRNRNVLFTLGVGISLLATLFCLMALRLETFDFWESLYRQFATNIKVSGAPVLEWNRHVFLEPSRFYAVLCALWDSIWNRSDVVSSASLRALHLAMNLGSIALLVRQDGNPLRTRKLFLLFLSAPLFLLSSLVVSEMAVQLFSLSLFVYFMKAPQNRLRSILLPVSFALLLLTHDMRLLWYEFIACAAAMLMEEPQNKPTRKSAAVFFSRVLYPGLAIAFLFFNATHAGEDIFATLRGIATLEWTAFASRWHGETSPLQIVFAIAVGSGALGGVFLKTLIQRRLGIFWVSPYRLCVSVAIGCYVLSTNDLNFWRQMLGWAPLFLCVGALKDDDLLVRKNPFETLFLAIATLTVWKASLTETLPLLFEGGVQQAFEFAARQPAVKYLLLTLTVVSFVKNLKLKRLQHGHPLEPFAWQASTSVGMAFLILIVFLIPYSESQRFELSSPLQDGTVATAGLLRPSIDLSLPRRIIQHYAWDDPRALDAETIITDTTHSKLCTDHNYTVRVEKNNFIVCEKREQP